MEKINPTFTFLLNQLTLLEYGKIVSPLILIYCIIPRAALVQWNRSSHTAYENYHRHVSPEQSEMQGKLVPHGNISTVFYTYISNVFYDTLKHF